MKNKIFFIYNFVYILFNKILILKKINLINLYKVNYNNILIYKLIILKTKSYF